MKIESYNPVTMAKTGDDITDVDFGIGVKGQYAENVVVIRPVPEEGETFTQIGLFLEDNAGLNYTRFGNVKSTTPIYNMQAGDARLSDFFIGHLGVSDFRYSDDGVLFDNTTPEYLWMNALVGNSEHIYGQSNINLRFVFEYA